MLVKNKKSRVNEIFKFVNSKKKYIHRLKRTTLHLKYLREEVHQGLQLLLNNSNNKFLIFYVVHLCFSESNAVVQVSSANGQSKVFFNGGLLDLSGKQKISKKLVLIKFIKVLSKLNFLKNKPIALHLKNMKSTKQFLLKKLKSKFFIKIIKTFDLKPYNGCRKKKKRRKR